MALLKFRGQRLYARGRIQSAIHNITAGAAISAKRLVASNRQTAGVSSILVIGVAPEAIPSGLSGYLASSGLEKVVADAPLAATADAKVGVGGRVTKHTTSQTVIQTTITGVASSFTQPGAATVLDVAQAADVAADRGRVIVVVGSDAAGEGIYEEFTLNAANSSVTVTGTTEFTKVCGAYTKNGAVLGAQNVTIKVSGGATICTIAGASSHIGAPVPAQSTEAYCNAITCTGPNSDATFITILGYNSSDVLVAERGTLNGASPSVFTTTTVFRTVERVCLGEFTNAATGNAKTNVTVDTAGMKCGVVVVAASTRGDDATVLIKPNA